MKKSILFILFFCLPFMAVGQDIGNRDNPYWTEIVTEQPEGYVVLGNGDVEISSAEGLAWLISVVNGLNGCAADDFEGRRITLVTNINLENSGKKNFTPIGNRTNRFMGNFDGDGHCIDGLHLRYENSTNTTPSDLGLFGYVFHGSVRNLSVNSGSTAFSSQNYEQWYQGYIAGISDSLSLIDNCLVKTRMSVTNGGSIVGLNRNSTIRNCAFMPTTDDTFVVELNGGGIALRNLSVGGWADAEISNCYFYGNILGSYSVLNMGGIVCYNQTANDNNGKAAIVKNCYSELHGELFGDFDNGCIVANNSEGSVVEFCYADLSNQYNSWGGLFGTNLGEINNCTDFVINNGDGLLSEAITIGSDETFSLLEALNNWICFQGTAIYNDWCEGEELPVFCANGNGINDTQFVVDGFIIYPNPTTGQFTVEGANVIKVEVYNLVGQKVCEQQGNKVVNMLGQHVLSVTGEGNVLKINMQRLPRGVYFVNVTDNEGKRCVKKVVKE